MGVTTIQANRKTTSHRYLGNALVPTHRHVNVPTSPVRMDTCRCLGCFHQQEAQQRTAWLTDVPQSLLAGTGVFTRQVMEQPTSQSHDLRKGSVSAVEVPKMEPTAPAGF